MAHTIRCEVLFGGQGFLQLLRATWADHDTMSHVPRLADPKGMRTTAIPHVLPVPKRVAALLDALRALAGGDYIFSTTGGIKPIHHTSLSPVFAGIGKTVPSKKRAGVVPFQGRDIRRSVETRLQPA